MGLRRARAGVAVLQDGRVIVAGGTDLTEDFGSAELYLEAEDRWEWVSAPMWSARSSPFVALLPSGEVLIAGGDQEGQPLGDTEVFDPVSLQFRAIGALTAPRTAIAGAVIPDSAKILATGGTGPAGPSPLCGIVVVSESFLRTLRSGATSSEFDAGETVTANGSGFRDGLAVRFSLARKDGVSQSARLFTASVLPSSTAFQVPLRMRQLATQLVLRPNPSPSFQPLTLSVFLTGCPIATDCSRLPAATGTIRFFDGDLQLGVALLAAIGNGAAVASLSGVTRPSGTRQFRKCRSYGAIASAW
jgi:hypothetical protein